MSVGCGSRGSSPSATATSIASPTPIGRLATEVVERLILSTRDPEWKARWDAVNALGESQDPRAIPALAERAMKDDNSHPRWRALWAIGNIQRDGLTAKPLFLAGLSDADPNVVRNCAIALAFFFQPEGRSELIKGLDDPDSYRRWEAVFSIKNIPSPEVENALITKLDVSKEQATEVRSEAALSLADIGGDTAAQALLAVLTTDPAPSVRLRAVFGLTRLADASVLPQLQKALESETDSQVRKYLVEAIGTFQTKG